MSAVPAPQPIDPVKPLLAKVREVAVLPHVVYKVVELSGSAESSTGQIENAISVDPGFSSRLLTVANSAYYALPKKITSIKDAIMFLGFKTIRQIAMTVGLYDMFVGKTDKESLRRRQWWRRSVDTAICCKWMARETRKLSPEDAYTCGLLHLIGCTLLDRFGDGDYERVEALAEHGMPVFEAEQKVFGAHHADVAVAAATQWGFPDALVQGLMYHQPPADPEDPYLMHRACVAVGSLIAKWALEGLPESGDYDLPQWAREALGVTEESVPTLVERAMSVIAEAAAMQI